MGINAVCMGVNGKSLGQTKKVLAGRVYVCMMTAVMATFRRRNIRITVTADKQAVATAKRHKLKRGVSELIEKLVTKKPLK